ncbi:MAG: hypothetical protein K2K91_03145, partial [Ruminococcus sp.]|nr:hypothetical protein [Ruminococcus sp.]
MKKLLAAVTSIAMSASLMTSAFASSITVSAASGSSAVQPNVSMGGVMDGAANKIAGESDFFTSDLIAKNKSAQQNPTDFETAEDFIISGQNVTAKPGDTIDVRFTVKNPGNHLSATYVAIVNDFTDGMTYEMKDKQVYAVDEDEHGAKYYNKMDDTYQVNVVDEETKDPVEVIEDGTIMKLSVKIPDNIADGTYEYSLKSFKVVENAQVKPAKIFYATLNPGTITIEGGSGSTTTSSATTASSSSSATTASSSSATTATTTGTKPAHTNPDDFPTASDFIIKGQDITAKPGDTVDVRFLVSNPGNHLSATYVAIIDDFPAEITYEMKDKQIYAVDEDEHGAKYYVKMDDTYQVNVVDEDSKDPVEVTEGGTIMKLSVKIPDNIADGVYNYSLKSFKVVENAQVKPAKVFYATIIPGSITIGEGGTTTSGNTTTTKATTVTTTASSSSATTASGNTTTTAAPGTTTAPVVNPATGKAEWLIPTVHAKPGEEVTMNVIVNGASDLAVAGASYTVKAASPIEFGGVNGQSSAYGAAIVNNAQTNEFAFGEGKGAGVTASDKAVIMTLTYKVPANATKGTYPVEWSDAFISDTNGLEITSNVTLTNGAIIIDEAEHFDGNISWKIPTVHAKPGETVTMDVVVDDTAGAALPVAGAQFAIEAKAPVVFDSVSGTSAAYSATVVNNASTNEFAFGEGKGAGIAAANGSKVITLTYKVPNDIAKGEYPVTWGGDVYISDTNGNALTSQISLVNGSIIIDDAENPSPEQGDISWVIPTVEAQPGDTVTMEVLVNVGSKNLAVAGAQFEINAATPVGFAGVSGSAGYGATVVNNEKTNEFAFGEGKGAGVEAADKSAVLTLTYTVPADAKPGTTYPVKWANAFISDTNGLEITSSVKLVDGAIVIPDEKTTASTTASTTTPPVTTTTVTAPEGKIAWKIDTVEAAPGDDVSLRVIIVDNEGIILPIGGAQYSITETTPIEYVGASGKSEAYGADIVANAGTKEFAFADAKGAPVAASDGAIVMTLNYKVPADCAEGTYPVVFGDKSFFNISSADGVDMTDQIGTIDGAIIVKKPVSTTQSSTTLTSTTTSTTVITTSTSTASSTTTTSATTQPTTTTTIVTAPEGNIIWKIDTVEAVPGDEVKLNVIVNDSRKENLPIGGAQYIITETTPIQYVGVSDKSEGYGANIISNADTKEFAFADAKGAGVAASDGAIVMTLTYKVPADCADGTYPVVFGDTSFFNISSADGVDMSNHIHTVDGAIIVKKPATTTTSGATTTTTSGATTTTTSGSTTTTTSGSTTTTTTTAPVTTTTASVPDGVLIWQGDTVVAHPGEKVEVNFVVNDKKESKLSVAGAEFKIGVTGDIKLVGGTGSEGYAAEVVGKDNGYFAFGESKGAGVVAPDGSSVITLTFNVPDTVAPGNYPVSLSELFVSDTNGADITNNIFVIDGLIIVEDSVTTTATTTTTAPPTTTTSGATTTTTSG